MHAQQSGKRQAKSVSCLMWAKNDAFRDSGDRGYANAELKPLPVAQDTLCTLSFPHHPVTFTFHLQVVVCRISLHCGLPGGCYFVVPGH